MARRDNPDSGLSPEQTAQLGELAAKPLSESAAPEIRRALASRPAPGRAPRRGRRGSVSSERGGAETGSVAAPPLRLAEGGS